MYSPKIRADLIPRIYRAAKEAKLPMTAWVNQAVEKFLPETVLKQTTPQTQEKSQHEDSTSS